MPHISVVMPVRNGARYVESAARSILSQTFSDLELIVVDDGSEDGSRALVESIDDGRIRVLDAGGQRGIAAALNTGLDAARGELVARMDADDLAHIDRLRQQVAYLRDHPDVTVVGSACDLIDGDGRPLGTLEVPTEPEAIDWELLFENPIVHPTVLARRESLRYATDAPHAEDYDLWARLAARHRLANLPARLLSLRQHPEQVSATRLAQQQASSDAIRAAALGRLLGRTLDDSLTRAWGAMATRRPLASEAELRAVALLIEAALIAFDARWRPSADARRVIRRRAARRLLALARVNGRRFPLALPRLVVRAALLSPDALGSTNGGVRRRGTIAGG